jgi:hypothetical protein
MTRAFAFIAIFLTFAVPAVSQDRLSVLLGSHHAGAQIRFEAANPGLFLTWEDRAFGLDWSVGAFRNSYGRGSVALTAGLPVIRWQGGQASLVAGLAHYPGDGRRFRISFGDVVPLVGVQARHGPVFAQVLPGDGRFADAVFSVGLTFNLKGK